MSNPCGCPETPFDGGSASYRRALWWVIGINAIMCIVEFTLGIRAQSQALQADALDFLGDTLTYSLSLYVVGMSVRARTLASLLKGSSLAVMGFWVLGSSIYRILVLETPAFEVMGTIGFIALVANLTSVAILLRFKEGDANVRSVWICSRNDAFGNLAVILAAGGVWGLDSAWPDLLVAVVMASLFLSGAFSIIRQAVREYRHEGRKRFPEVESG